MTRIDNFDTHPAYGSGPHLALVGAAVRLARRDLEDPEHFEEATAFLRGEPFDGKPVGVEIDLFAELLGYGGSFI